MASKYLNANVKKLSRSQLEVAVESLAKTANQRLRELEKSRGGVRYSEHSSAYAYVEKLAFDKGKVRKGDEYKRAFIEGTKAEKPKFSRKVKKMDEATLRAELEVLQNFLTAKTTTVTGTKEHLERTYKLFKDKVLGEESKLSQEQYQGFWDDALIKNAMSLFYGSMGDLWRKVEEKNLKAEDLKAILGNVGIDENTTDEDIEENNITFSDVLELIDEW